MDQNESQQKFQQADAFFKENRHADALTLLLELNQAHPNAKNILYPMALCYQNLGRGDEAIPICDYLLQHYQDQRAQALKQRIESEAIGGIPGLGAGLDDLLDYQAPAKRPPVQAPETDWKRYALIGGGVLVVLLIIVVPLMLADGSGGGGNAPAQAAPQEAGELTNLQLWAIGFVIQIIASTPLMYMVLSIMHKLPHDAFLENVGDVALYAIITCLVAIVPLVGWIIALVIISNHYELTCGELLIFVCLEIAFAFGLIFMIGFALGAMGLWSFPVLTFIIT